MKNLHKLFYKDYFKDVGFTVSDEEVKANKNILNAKNSELLNSELKEIPAPDYVNQKFPLKISYPGLITGVGINHEAGIEGEFKLGVHFDYTRGMPVVYGSSVKGVLRSYFVAFLLNKKKDFDKKVARQFEDDVFEGKNKNGNKPLYERDIFFDAVIVKANAKGKILESDTLCPHGENPLKNPKPISFLKIASGVTMEFRFKLVKSEIDGKTLSAEDKKQIFEEILKTVGVGAKTNVGYGQFV
ncbi:MAG: type III-B CRISPR module RAMP protein Cmr6 [Dysgonamonadaceae bacterium]|jgi:CRISPR-associated protein Cmr6|nr:type III-B CRISPR module RAMP protein Cmr6 [Dysgonamonadaceae bacterium]